jgi:hypothetical protein
MEGGWRKAGRPFLIRIIVNKEEAATPRDGKIRVEMLYSNDGDTYRKATNVLEIIFQRSCLRGCTSTTIVATIENKLSRYLDRIYLLNTCTSTRTAVSL